MKDIKIIQRHTRDLNESEIITYLYAHYNLEKLYIDESLSELEFAFTDIEGLPCNADRFISVEVDDDNNLKFKGEK